MVGTSPLVADFAAVLGVAAATGVLARRLRQPPVLGYLLAGLLVGPYIPLPLFADIDRVRGISELGVVLVMFTVGLEFSLGRAARVLPTAGLAAAVQISGLFWGGNLAGVMLGLPTAGQVVLGAGLCVSSTMVVTRMFELHQPPADVRGLVLGVLVLQDIVAIILVAIVTALSEGAGASSGDLLGVVVRLGVTVGVAGLVGLVVIPRATRAVAKFGMPEIDTVFAVGVCFALGGVMQSLGYSPALGAFLAGTLVAESGLASRYEHLVAPVRDVFAAIFFVSIGMQVDPLVAGDHVLEILGVATLVILLQLSFVGVAGLLSGQGLRKSIHAGLALGQVGEFAFIIVGIGVTAGLLSPALFTIVVGAAVVTTFTTNAALSRAGAFAERVEHVLPQRFTTLLSMYSAWVGRATRRARLERTSNRRHVALLAVDAVAVAGIVIAASFAVPPAREWLERQGIPPKVVLVLGALGVLVVLAPFAAAIWRVSRAVGIDLSNAALPRNDGAAAITRSSRAALSRALQLSASLGTGMVIVAVTRPFVPPGTGVLILSVLLVPAAFSLWRTTAPLEAQVESATGRLFELLRRQPRDTPPTPEAESLLQVLGDVSKVLIPSGAPCVGATLTNLDLRAKTGAAVLAVVDGRGVVAVATSQEPLQSGSVLLLTGPPSAVLHARRILLGHDGTKPDGDVGSPHESKQHREDDGLGA